MLNFFTQTSYLEPKCPNCLAKIDYGVTTKFDDLHQMHICMNCNKQV